MHVLFWLFPGEGGYGALRHVYVRTDGQVVSFVKQNQAEMKKGNKQCLFDTPRKVMVNKNNEKWLS